MTDEAKALVEQLREVKDWWRQPGILAEQTADLIETQAREIERLRGELTKVTDYCDLAAIRIARATIAGHAALAGDSHDQ